MDRKKRNIHRKGTDPAFRTGKIKKYKRAKPENKEMTDIKIRSRYLLVKGKNTNRKPSPHDGK